MAIRLYDGVYVHVEGAAEPVRVTRHAQNAGLFHVGDFVYDIDGRTVDATSHAPKIEAIVNLQTMRELGLRLN